jgi:tetratricopeptide (TPR) repeat protein
MVHRRLAIPLIAAFTLATLPAAADQNDPRLDALFAKLKAAASNTEAETAERQIWQIWIENRNPELERLMREGIAAMNEDDNDAALDRFSEIVKYDKGFAEAWNKRATVEYEMGDYAASVADIERTLALEPRHFGALSGLGLIYLATDHKAEALKAFRAALAINPRASGLREKVEELEKDVKGSPI